MKKTYAHIVLGVAVSQCRRLLVGRHSAGQNGAGQSSAGVLASNSSRWATTAARPKTTPGSSGTPTTALTTRAHPAAYAHWRDLELQTGLELLRITGGLDLAPAGGAGEAEIASYARALAEQGHDYQLLDAAGLRARWPQCGSATTSSACTRPSRASSTSGAPTPRTSPVPWPSGHVPGRYAVRAIVLTPITSRSAPTKRSSQAAR